MTEKRVFVIKNQREQYLDKQSSWQSGKDANALFRVDFHDQALNTLIEVNAKDITLRGKIIEVALDEKKRPVVEVSDSALALDKNNATAIAESEQAETCDDSLQEETVITVDEDDNDVSPLL